MFNITVGSLLSIRLSPVGAGFLAAAWVVQCPNMNHVYYNLGHYIATVMVASLVQVVVVLPLFYLVLVRTGLKDFANRLINPMVIATTTMSRYAQCRVESFTMPR